MAENKYELIVVLSPVLGEEGYVSTTEAIKTKLETEATIDVVEILGVKRLAYEIDDQKDGYYLQINYTSGPDFPKEVERVLRLTDGVLRYLTVRVEQ